MRKIGLLIRRALPSNVRHVLRLGSHLISTGQPSPAIPPELLEDCRVCASRLHMLGKLSPGGRVAEIGTYRGEFAKQILAICRPAELHLVDLDFSILIDEVAADARVQQHRGLSSEILRRFPDGHFNWIYVDANHTHAAVREDAEAAARKVKPGGLLIFNDFAHIDPYLGTYGVHRAVVEFATEHAWRFVWLAYEPHALYDVALQRPIG